MGKICYPKMIFKGDPPETMVVKNAYEHAEKVKEGWSGPPEWESALPDLKREIVEAEANLVIMRERLVFMEQFEADRNVGVGLDQKGKGKEKEKEKEKK